MQGQENQMPGVGFKKLKKILNKCRRDVQSKKKVHGHGAFLDLQSCPRHCPGRWMDKTYFYQIKYVKTCKLHFNHIKSLSSKIRRKTEERKRDEENVRRVASASQAPGHYLCATGPSSLPFSRSDVVNCFNERAQKLLELHLASGFRKYFIWFKAKLQGSHIALIQEGKDLLHYAMINAIAIRKILKKYDKVHYSKQGQAFRSQAQSMHIEILQSPWLCELMAFHVNLSETKAISGKAPALFEDCYLTFNYGKPFLSCELFDSVKLDIDLTCSICNPASVTIVDGLRAGNPKEKCPLCREAGVYEGAVNLDELSVLLRRSCREYWEQRLEKERVERVRQAKQHWESQFQAFIGL
ncbi:hypothetical protein J1N35_021015 [Gossypium stocksii]|uniref:RING-type E3 ubiquitin transferase n=1 Tax=Gossypium stocksii TaxID=47602 RepID=A0A9D3VF17_9ROSI|nr:hypothetical protein J1N35_021015 [Gossypium stocksii]